MYIKFVCHKHKLLNKVRYNKAYNKCNIYDIIIMISNKHISDNTNKLFC